MNHLMCLDLIEANAPEPWRKSLRAADWVGAAILEHTGQTNETTAKKFAIAMVERLEDEGYLVEYMLKDRSGQDRPCYNLNAQKLAEIRDMLR